MNIKLRLKNKLFWLALIPALILLINQVLKMFNIDFAHDEISRGFENLINVVFSILAIFGVVNDPTTKGFDDDEDTMKKMEL